MRVTFEELLYTALKTLGPHEKAFYFEYNEPTEQERYSNKVLISFIRYADIDHPVEKIPKAVCVKFMHNFLEMMEFTRQHWRKFMQYWKLLGTISNSNIS